MTSPSTPGSAGFGAGAEPPPVTAFAFRNGLVRPAQGRILAGVCAALGRATNTDPVASGTDPERTLASGLGGIRVDPLVAAGRSV